MRTTVTRTLATTLAISAFLVFGCGFIDAPVFSPVFTNVLIGGEFPVTPGPNAAFVMVRVVNETTSIADFIVTIERTVIVTDDQGNPLFDEDNNVLTRNELETRRLRTFPTALANDMGVLFPCGLSPVIAVGLGETLRVGDAAAIIISDFDLEVGEIGVGFGVPAEGLNPLRLASNNFNCGDTIIFRAFVSTASGAAGNVKFESFLLPGSEQPATFNGPSTFLNYERFLESQIREEELPNAP